MSSVTSKYFRNTLQELKNEMCDHIAKAFKAKKVEEEKAILFNEDDRFFQEGSHDVVTGILNQDELLVVTRYDGEVWNNPLNLFAPEDLIEIYEILTEKEVKIVDAEEV